MPERKIFMNKVIGVKHSKGSFETNGKTIDYDNIVCYLITDTDDSVIGLTASEIKIKVENFEKITGLKLELMSELVDKEISLGYGLVKSKPVLERITVLKK